HEDNNEYVKNIDQEHLQQAQAEPKESHLVSFDSSSSEGWIENAAWIEYINVLIELSDLKRLMESLDIVSDAGGLEQAKKKLEMSIFNAFLLVAMEKCQNPYMVHIERMQQAIRDHESIYGGGDE
ncbi:hypothetical protein SH917_20030, partial [Acinetobacter baumannii]|nr:hypothetical protein [Acinetobacter baumannii]